MILIPPNNNKENDLKKRPNDTINESLVPEVIRSEVNFLVLPFFALWDKDIKRKTKTEYMASVKRQGERLEISWTVTSNAEYGYPGPFDRTVHKAIEQIISKFPRPIQNPIPIGSLYSLCKRMGISSFGGSQYRKIKEALERITTTSIKSGGAFYSKGKKEWIEEIFHLYERVIFKGKTLPDGEISDTNYLYLNSWYLDNVNANYVKPVDWEYYKLLENPIAQRLYELLSVKFYGLLSRGGRFISYRYSTLCSLLPITQQKYLSLAKKILDPSHIKLKETGFLRNCDWEKTSGNGESDWLIKYYPGKRARDEIKRFSLGEQLELELPAPNEKKSAISKPELSGEESKIAEGLVQRGITRTTAMKMVRSHPIEQIQRQMAVFDWLRESKSPLVGKNPAGFLRKSIEEGYQPPEDYLSHKETESQRQRDQERRERWLQHRDKLIRQDIANWDKTLPEERVSGRLDAWIFTQQASPTQNEIERKLQELIDSLPQTDQEKWEYISGDYPDEPPPGFE